MERGGCGLDRQVDAMSLQVTVVYAFRVVPSYCTVQCDVACGQRRGPCSLFAVSLSRLAHVQGTVGVSLHNRRIARTRVCCELTVNTSGLEIILVS